MLDIIHPNFDVVAEEAVVPLFKRNPTAVERFHRDVVTMATHKAAAVLAGHAVLPQSKPDRPRTVAQVLDESSTELAQHVVNKTVQEVIAKAGAALNFD